MKLSRYFIPVVISYSIGVLIFSFLAYLLSIISSDILISILLGCGIPFINFLLGFYSIKISLNQGHSAFLIIFLGGMVIRLFLMLLAVFLVLRFLENIAYSFIFIIFIFYSFYLISEILYLNKLKNS